MRPPRSAPARSSASSAARCSPRAGSAWSTRRPMRPRCPAVRRRPRPASGPTLLREPSTVTSRAHRRLVPVLIVLASLVGTVAVFAVWLDRQAFNAGEWTRTSGRLLENGQVRAAVANYEVDVLYANVDVTGELAQLLP